MKPPFFRSSVLTVCLAVMAFRLPALAQAATLTVPTQYLTIQAAINAAASGDTVLVAAGTYSGPGNQDIDFSGKSLVVTSQAGPSSTIIDCGGYKTTDGSGNHRGFYLHSGEKSATISGFTVKNGYEAYVSGVQDSGNGGGICNDNSRGGTLTLTNCTVSGNTAQNGPGGYGGGIYNDNYGGTLTLTNCTVSGNTATYYGGGIYTGFGTVTLTNCTVSANTASTGNTAAHGGGIYNYSVSATLTLTNCTVSANTVNSGYGGGIYNYSSGSGTITLTNSIFYGDTGGEVMNGTGTASILFSDIQGGYSGTGNINADPKFVSATDFHLHPGSPCLGAGTATGAPATDFDGTTRPNPPSIGAYDIAGSGTGIVSKVTHVLWNNVNGAASIWNYSPADGSHTHQEYGPYVGYTAAAIADGGTDGKTRVLWNKTDGSASIWSLDNSTGQFAHFEFGPFTGYTATALSVATDNTTHVLWTNTNGSISVWNYAAASGGYTHKEYGPFAGYTAKAIADGPDGKSRLLWTKADGTMSLWSFDNSAGTFAHAEYGPYPGYMATGVSVGIDNTTHMLWDNTNGMVSVWNYSTASNTLLSHREYGPYAGWTAKAVSDGADGKTRLLWDNADGRMSLWGLNNITGIFGQFTYGPYSGWTANAVSGF